MKKLPREFYNRDTKLVAKELLGKYLVHRVRGKKLIGKIVEVEAYLGPHDLAAHSARGRTKRTEVMFGPPGHAYVYLIYGIYYCMNVVTEPQHHASAVLLRAVEPIANIEGKTKGPGLLCKAMHIDKRLHGSDLLSKDFYIAETEIEDGHETTIVSNRKQHKHIIVKRPRIGVDYAKHWAKRHLRFYLKGNPFVSKL